MNFDEIKDRRAQFSSKWGSMKDFCGLSPDEAIAMWVADMDFDAAPCIQDALRADVDAGFLGYVGNTDRVNESICSWMESQHEWAVRPDWIRYSHGVVAGFGNVLAAFSDPGDGIILFTPVYHAFFAKARAMGRGIVESELALRDGQYHMDLDALAGQLSGREKIAVFCSPHNPGGRLWKKSEIAELAEFCGEHALLLLSDEIHMDLTYPGAKHIASAHAAPADNLITITAASKSFNIAGGETGFVIIEDEALRARYDAAHKDRGGTPNRFGMIMMQAAFTGGAEWIAAVREYLAGNFALWQKRINAIPGLKAMDMSSTYLSWVDFSGTGMPPDQTMRRLHDAGIAMSPGAQFGKGGEDWHRFNIAMPRPLLKQAISRIEGAFADLQ